MSISLTLIKSGNPEAPRGSDVIQQILELPIGENPEGDGWKIGSRLIFSNIWTRTCLRALAEL